MADRLPGRADAPIVVSVDQGTSSTKAVAVDADGSILATATVSVGQAHPAPGWVEQDAVEIAESVDAALHAVAEQLGSHRLQVGALGLSTQRESAVIWDRRTGEPLGPVLGWQDRRTRDRAEALSEADHDELVRGTTGLPIDPMFSALKFEWLLDAVDPDRSRSARGEIALGTVDSWVLARATGEHRIEAGNASRTLLMDLTTVDWSEELLEFFRIPRSALPRITASNEPSATYSAGTEFAPACRFTGVLADSHAALYAHGATAPGDVKVTYGTGSSIMGIADTSATPAGLVRTLAWHDGTPTYAFEGNILSTGATLVWLSNLFGISTGELSALAERVPADHGVELVPAFAGLAAPWWDERAQGIITGLTLGTDRDVLARAAMESVVLQIEDVLSAVDAEAPRRLARVFVDGGPTANGWLMQLQADFGQRVLIRSDVPELSALGAAHLAGVSAGIWSAQDIAALARPGTEFRPRLDPEAAATRRASWLAAIARSRRSPAPLGTPV
jgi:glycerol kinase